MKTIWRFQGIFGHLDQSHNHKATSTRYFSLNPKPENPDFGDKYFYSHNFTQRRQFYA